MVVSAQIADECSRRWRKAGPFEIAEHYVVNPSFYRLDVLRLDDLLWASAVADRRRQFEADETAALAS